MTAKVAILKLAPNNSARFNSSGPTSRSLMQNSSSVYEQQHRIKFGENGEKSAEQYRHHHKRKKSKKKRDRSSERKKGATSSSRSGENQNHLEDHKKLLYFSSGASNDMHSVGLPSDGGGVKFDLIQQDEDDDDEDGGQELLLDGLRHRKRKRDHSPSSINDGGDDGNVHASKRINNGDMPRYSFGTPPSQSRMSRTERTPPGSDEEEEEDDDDFDLVSEEPYSYPYNSEVSNNVSVVISTLPFEEEENGVQVMSDEDDDDDDEDNDAVTTTPIPAIATHLELNHHVENGPISFDAPSNHHQYHREESVLEEEQVEETDIRLPNVIDNEFNRVIQQVDEDEVAADEVTSCSQIDVESLHTDRIPNVNGNFDSSGEFHQWHQSYAVESYSGEPLHILPYAVIDF